MRSAGKAVRQRNQNSDDTVSTLSNPPTYMRPSSSFPCSTSKQSPGEMSSNKGHETGRWGGADSVYRCDSGSRHQSKFWNDDYLRNHGIEIKSGLIEQMLDS